VKEVQWQAETRNVAHAMKIQVYYIGCTVLLQNEHRFLQTGVEEHSLGCVTAVAYQYINVSENSTAFAFRMPSTLKNGGTHICDKQHTQIFCLESRCLCVHTVVHDTFSHIPFELRFYNE
jgi:hypothetical protein